MTRTQTLLNELLAEARATEEALRALQAADPAIARVAESVLYGRLTEAGITAAMRNASGAVFRGLGAVNEKMNQLGRLLQNTTPIRDFDDRFEALRQQVAAKFPVTSKALGRYGEFARTHSKTQAFTIGVLTVMASLGAGPAGGAVAAAILRSANELLKGEKASTAIGKAAVGAAVGALAGLSIGALSQAIEANVIPIPHLSIAPMAGVRTVRVFYQMNGQTFVSFYNLATDERAAQIRALFEPFVRAMNSGDLSTAARIYPRLQDEIFAASSAREYDKIEGILRGNTEAIEKARAWREDAVAKLGKVTNAIIAAAQGAAAGAEPKAAAATPAPKPRIVPKVDMPKPAAAAQTRNPWAAGAKKRPEPADAALWREVVRDMAIKFGRVPNEESARWAMQTYKRRGGSWS